jgi:hypothetical protein
VYRVSHSLDAGIPLVESKAGDERTEFVGRHEIAGGEQGSAGAEQFDIGLDADFDQVAALIGRGPELEHVPGVARAHDVRRAEQRQGDCHGQDRVRHPGAQRSPRREQTHHCERFMILDS